jgi:hypothetical protein
MRNWNLSAKIWALMGCSWLVGLGSSAALRYQPQNTVKTFERLETHEIADRKEADQKVRGQDRRGHGSGAQAGAEAARAHRIESRQLRCNPPNLSRAVPSQREAWSPSIYAAVSARKKEAA